MATTAESRDAHSIAAAGNSRAVRAKDQAKMCYLDAILPASLSSIPSPF